MASPPEFGGLRAFAGEAFHGPGVHELAHALGHVRRLRVALGDMDDLHTEIHRELRPCLPGLRRRHHVSGIARHVEERLLHEARHPARIGAMGGHDGRAGGVIAAQFERRFTHRVVGTQGWRHGGVGISAGPRLDTAVQVHYAAFKAELHQRDRRHVHGEVEQEISLVEPRHQDLPVVLRRQGRDLEGDAVAGSFFAPALVGGHDADLRSIDIDMPQNEGKHPLSNASEADENQFPGIPYMLVFLHFSFRNLHVEWAKGIEYSIVE